MVTLGVIPMIRWQKMLKYDPIPALLAVEDKAVTFFVERDLLDNASQLQESLWNLPIAREIVAKQQKDGAWKYPGGNVRIRSAENYNQIETFRNLGYLIEMFGFNRSHPAISHAADFLFQFQTQEGDIRGILGNQYAPYYTAAMIELLIKAGYAEDPHIHKIFLWLESVRQDDGGWAIPLRTHGKKLDIIAMNSPTLEPLRTKPFSHLVTGIVLRAYAADKLQRKSEVAHHAGKLLLGHLFKKDNYTDRDTPAYWTRFTYPFWFTDLISALDTLSLLGFSESEPPIQKALMWFVDQQDSSGLWKLKTLKNEKRFNNDLWVSLAICRIFKRYYS
jgi:hypothetical protein